VLDCVEIAHGMGMAGRCITHPNEFQPVVVEALALGMPYVLEVVTKGSGPAQ
jgi:thiamine pyrophosphate-dependent acetolactate synthase large subunit-like protein